MRAEWDIKGRTKSDIISAVVARINTANITDFVEKSMGLTKQHVYLFEHDLKHLTDLADSVLDTYGPDNVHKTNTSTEFFDEKLTAFLDLERVTRKSLCFLNGE